MSDPNAIEDYPCEGNCGRRMPDTMVCDECLDREQPAEPTEAVTTRSETEPTPNVTKQPTEPFGYGWDLGDSEVMETMLSDAYELMRDMQQARIKELEGELEKWENNFGLTVRVEDEERTDFLATIAERDERIERLKELTLEQAYINTERDATIERLRVAATAGLRVLTDPTLEANDAREMLLAALEATE